MPKTPLAISSTSDQRANSFALLYTLILQASCLTSVDGYGNNK